MSTTGDSEDLTRYLVALEQPFSSDQHLDVEPTDLVRFALTASDYWSDLGLGWIEDGLDATPLHDDLWVFSQDKRRPQRARHRAWRLVKHTRPTG